MVRSVFACSALAAVLSAFALPAAAADKVGLGAGDLVVRLRGLAVIPQESATVTPIGGSVEIDNSYVPELDVSYFLTNNLALELIAATTPHRVKDNGSSLGDLDLGKVWLLPPTLTLQWHFLPRQSINPYVGAGINYTIFYNEKAPGGTVQSIKYEDSFGWALQAGVDVALGGPWFLNVDVKKLFLSTDVSINGGGVTADVDIDPWIVGLGLGYRF